MKQTKQGKRLIAAFLSLGMLATLLPVMTMPVYAAPSELPASVAAVLEQDKTAPAEFNNAKDPYGLMGTADGRTLSAFSELTYSLTNEKMQEYFSYDNYKSANKVFNQKAYFGMDSQYFESFQSKYKADFGDIRYLQSDAADLDGDGAKESAVYVGLQLMDGLKKTRVVTWYVNMKTGEWSDLRAVPNADEENLSWFSDFSKNTINYQALNFMSIAAGDFNGDGVDTWFVYYPGGGANYGIYEFKANAHENSTDKRIFIDKGDKRQSYLNQGYMMDTGIQGSNQFRDALSADLAAGDFNGDGYDDLAVVSYTNSISTKYDGSIDKRLYEPYLAVGYGTASGIPTKSDKKVSVSSTYGNTDYIPIAPSLSAGDMDHDGKDEIMVAGYYGEAEFKDTGCSMKDSARDKNYINAFTYQADSSSRLEAKYQKLDANGWIKGDADTGVWLGTSSTSDVVWQPMAVQCGALDGPGNGESVFIGGSIYRWNGSQLELRYTPDYFKNVDNGADGWTVSVPYIPSVVAGVFDGNMEGKEQFAYVVGLKQYIASNNYKFGSGIVGNENGNDYASVPGEHGYRTYNGTDGTMVLTAVDRDDDILRIRFNDKVCIWDDPSVVSILQAAPYFGELGDYGSFDNGATTYSYSTSYEEENGTTRSHALGVGLNFEIEAAETFEMEIQAGYSGEWSSETVAIQGTELTYEIEAGPYDTVILKRTPIYEYNYAIYNAETKEWEYDSEHSYSVWITGESMLYSLSVDDYNAFVDTYNEMMKDVNGFAPFEKLTEENAAYLFGNEGNPYAYNANMEEVLSTSVQTLGHNGGSHSISYAKSYGEGASESQADGFSLAIQFAVAIPATPMKLGAYAETDHKWGTTRTVSNTDTTETAGTVANIDAKGIAYELGVSESTIRKYGFNWTFGTWDVNLGGAGNVPVYGYNTYSVTSSTAKVTDLSYELADDGKSITFDWSEPQSTDDAPIDGYFLYMVEGTGDLKKFSEEFITDTTYTLTDFDRTKDYTFAVTAATKRFTADQEHYYYTEGLFSNLCVHNGDLSGKSAYEIAVENGFVGTEKEWLASLTGKKGADGVGVEKIELTATQGNIDTYSIWFTDGSVTVFTVTNGEAGQDGEAGRGVVTIEKTSSDDLVDTYTIKYTDGTTDTFTVTNGEKGEQGAQGIPGEKGEQGVPGEKGNPGQDGQDGKDGMNGQNGINGVDGQNGVDGKDGTNGQTPYIGENGNWWIGTSDTGKTALAVSVSEIAVDENGQFVFMMSDGTTKYAKMPDGSVAVMAYASTNEQKSDATTRTIATTGVVISSVSLIWNLVALALDVFKKRKGMSV